MESIIARALEYTLKYWLKSFSRDQFKLQGRTAQLSNLGEVPFAPLSLSNLDADFDVFCFCFVIRVLSFFLVLGVIWRGSQISMAMRCTRAWGCLPHSPSTQRVSGSSRSR
jgi:hypothetical protein